ncbi:MAG: hypothetical protein ABUT39_29910 [Acidobacteriota bacterium]
MKPLPMLAVLLAVAMSAPLAAGEHDPPSDSSDLGRTAEPRVEPDPAPPPPSEDSGGSIGDESGGSVGEDPGGNDDSGGSVGKEPGGSSDESAGSAPRVAVPRSDSDNGSHQQRPHTGSRDGGGGDGGQGSGGDYGEPGYDASSDYVGGDGPGERHGRYVIGALGALDIDVRPGRTEVWIDGLYAGTADDFDGFPQHLRLDPGVHCLVLYREGYTTLSRLILVGAGVTINVHDSMRRGISVRPQDLDGRQGGACRPSF